MSGPKWSASSGCNFRSRDGVAIVLDGSGFALHRVGDPTMEHVIEISMEDVDPDTAPEIRAYAERRLSFALRRFRQHVQHVRVRLTDVNGPRHGVDARCAVTAHLTNGKEL